MDEKQSEFLKFPSQTGFRIASEAAKALVEQTAVAPDKAKDLASSLKDVNSNLTPFEQMLIENDFSL